MLRRALDVKCLTRPARLRCRPSLVDPPSAGQVRRYRAAVPKRTDEYGHDPPVPGFGRQRAEYDDYTLAVEMARKRKKRATNSGPGTCVFFRLDMSLTIA
jgi:DNA polymerase gamma 1